MLTVMMNCPADWMTIIPGNNNAEVGTELNATNKKPIFRIKLLTRGKTHHIII